MCEGSSEYGEDLNLLHQRLIDELKQEIKRSKLKNTGDLHRRNPKLYEKIRKTHVQGAIYYHAEFGNKKRSYMHWPDSWIIKEVGNYSCMTDLKYKNCTLHREVKGRMLENEIMLSWPHFCLNWKVGISGLPYRSYGELVVGNWLTHEKFLHNYDFPILCNNKGRSRRADFYLPSEKLILEIEQSRHSGQKRGSRRLAYEKRSEKKYKEYRASGYDFLCIDSDKYYDSGDFKAMNFCRDIRAMFMEKRIELPKIPDPRVLLRTINNEDKKYLIKASDEEVLNYLSIKLKINGIAELQNKHSPVNKLLSARKDGGYQVREKMKKRSIDRRSQKNIIHHRRKRNEYAHIDIAMDIVKENGISTQKEWFEWSKNNRVLMGSDLIKILI